MNPLLTRLGRAFLASLLLLLLAGAAVVAAADIGHKDFADSPSGTTKAGAVTGSKPESKVWFNDGIWWASMQPTVAGGFFIYRLDPNTETWSSTGTPLDDRSGTRADTLWDGTHLYVASQKWKADGGGTTSGTSGQTRLYRFSYSGGTYTLDNGFPASMRTNLQSETLVIAKDNTGMLWATWTRAATGGNLVYTNHTVGNDDTNWSAPAFLPVGGQGVGVTTKADDISTMIAFTVSGQHRIGVFWSNQIDQKDYFAWHVDGAADTAWTAETALAGSKIADDHMNVKTDSTGRIYAVVKTSINASNQPMIELLARQPGGGWSANLVANGPDCCTRAIVELDETANNLHVFMTGPHNGSGSGQSGGDIYEKVSSTSSISFPSGVGTPVMRDNTGVGLNDSSSTKQNVTNTTGLVVMAFDDDADVYWHHHDTLGGGPPLDPQPAFTQDKTSGPNPLAVQFTNQSTGTGSLTYAWDFGDGGTSTATDPPYTYNNPGTYTVKLTVTGSGGTNSVTKTNLITVNAPSSTLTLTPDADAQVKSDSATTNYGSLISIRTRDGSADATSTYWTYLRFKITGLTGSVTGAKLRLYATDASTNTQNVLATLTDPNLPSWIETGTGSITFNNAPTILSTLRGSSSVPTVNAYNEISLDPATINGTYVTLAMKSSGNNSAIFNSKEAGSNPPQLVITQTIAPANTLPTANGATATVTEDGSGPVALSGGDAETCDLAFSVVVPPTKGTVNFAGQTLDVCAGSLGAFTDTTSVTYTPNANANGSDTFTYKVNDGTADSAPATASITITAVNDRPAASPVSTSTPQNTAKLITLTGTDVDSCDLTFVTSLAGHGTVSAPNNPAGCAAGNPNTDTATVTYTPDNGFSGPDSFTFTVNDGALTSTPVTTVSITVTGGSPTTTTVPVLMDSQVQSGSINGNYGTLTPFRTREGADPIYRLYFKFQVPTLSGTVTSAKLRLYVTTASTSLQMAYGVADNTWTEAGITWANAPLLGVAGPSAIAASPVNTYIEIPIDPSAITSGTANSFAVKGSTTTSAYFNSKEAATNPPQLVIVTGP